MNRGVRRIAPNPALSRGGRWATFCASCAPSVLAITAITAITATTGSTRAIAAPPQVEIRAQTKLVIDKVRLVTSDTAEVQGSLIDSLTGDGIGNQAITVKIGELTIPATTQADGKFKATGHVEPGPQDIALAFRGSHLLEQSNLTQTSDPARAQVSLSFEFEEALGGVNVTVRATADDQPAKLAVELSAGAPADDKLVGLGSVQTGTPFLLTRKAAGGPGVRKVRAVFIQDDSRQGATAEKTVELSADSTTTMKLSATRLAFEDDLEITGKVADEDGHAIGRAAVTLASGDRRLAQGATAEDGTYRFKVEGEILGAGQWGVQVQADPGRSAIRPSRSTPEIIRVSEPQPVPVSYTIAAFLATGCAAGGFFMARARPWRRMRRAVLPAEMASHPAEDEQVDGGLVAAKPGIVSTLRRPNDDGFSGAVRDTVRGRPVADAVVRLRLQPGREEREAVTGPDGNFAFETLALGDWLAQVTAAGHVTETFVVSIPHRGELRGVRVDLVPVRERVFQLYRRAAEPILPEPRLWGVWSPRQIVDHVRSRRPSPALADLTSFVEEIYFSPRLAAESVLPEAAEQVERAIRERARTAS